MKINRLKNKHILVTGGAGFIGSHIVDGLIKLGAKVVVLDNLSSTGTTKNINHCLDRIRFIKGDLRDEKVLSKALNGIDYICHQAALRSVPYSVEKPYLYNDVNVNGTLKLFLKARGKGIKKIICASSSSVYGERSNFPERETDLAKPISPYAATKLIVEYYSYVFGKLYGMEIVNLRYFNVFGPRQSLDDQYAVVVPKFITCILKGERPPIYGDGAQERDFIYIDNVVSINITCLNKAALEPQVFNVGNGAPHSVTELFDSLKKITSSKIKAIYLPKRAGDVRKTHADISKVKKLLGWSPKISFEEGLKKTIEWFRNQMPDSR